ncbi:MAG: CotH kinase family protein [Flavobacteriales bacterium]|nr:CotH kinase family protein [Flavobacteriales bacterium]
MDRTTIRSFLLWSALVAMAIAWRGAVTTGAPLSATSSIGRAEVEVGPSGIRFRGAEGATIHVTTDGRVPTSNDRIVQGSIPLRADRRAVDASLRIPTSVQWRPPVPGLPAAITVRAAASMDGAIGPVTTRTVLLHAHALQVLSLTADPGTFFDPDSGIYVPGHGIFRTAEVAVQRFPRDHRWWKYPGNFQFRGKAWERQAHAELIDGRGAPRWSGAVKLRIHGNNTRGFPQHALRMKLPGSSVAWCGEERGVGHRMLVLRAGGNDQADSFLRDVVQHRLCAGLPFETSGSTAVVVYLNGAYWGLHQLRERIDAQELARRHGGEPDEYTVLEDRLLLYDGDQAEVKRFERMITMAERWDPQGPHYVDSLERRMDMDGFLTYMAAQIILGNLDWPDQNVKYWRWTGSTDTLGAPRDGRWRFIMGDSDMGLGYAGPVTADLFRHVEQHQGPVAQLHKAVLRSPVLRHRFRSIVIGLLDGPLSEASMVAAIDAESALIAPEMPHHVDRWRRPSSVAQWSRKVEELRIFARARGAVVRDQLHHHDPTP